MTEYSKGGYLPGESPREELLDEARRIVTRDRNSAYGEPEDNFTTIGELWTIQLKNKLKPGEVIDSGDVASLIIHVKQARRIGAPSRDNWTDTAGYAACGFQADVAAGRITPEKASVSRAPDPAGVSGLQPGDMVVCPEHPEWGKALVTEAKNPRHRFHFDWSHRDATVGRGKAMLRVYTANSPEPPADVTELRESAGRGEFLKRSGRDWYWQRVDGKRGAATSWERAAGIAQGHLVEYREMDAS